MDTFRTSGLFSGMVALGVALLVNPHLMAQQTPRPVIQAGFQVTQAVTNQVDMIVGTSRTVSFEFKISNVFVENPEILKADAATPNQLRLTGVKPGVSTLTVESEDGQQQLIVVNVTADIRRLDAALKTFFPDCAIKILALQEGVILGGHVAQTDQVEKIVAVAEDYFPTVISQLTVDGPQLVATKVRVYEVSRTKLRSLGMDWNLAGSDFDLNVVPQGGNALDNRTIDVLVGAANFEFFAFIEALEENNVAKLLDEPTLVAQHGQPAKFLSGGEIPYQQSAGLGATSTVFKPFGTELNVVSLVHGYGELTLNVQAKVSKPAPDLTDQLGNIGLRSRSVNTAVRMRAGHTLVLAGNYREDSDAKKSGIPKLMQSPLWGPLFRKVKSESNETELVFVITPRFISDVDPAIASKVGVGQLTDSPSDHELYINGYLEVPKCQSDCPTNDRFDDPSTQYAPQIQPALQEVIRQPSPYLPSSGSVAPLEPVIQPQSDQGEPATSDEVPVPQTVPESPGESARKPAKPPIISYSLHEGALRSEQVSNQSR